MKKLYSFEWSTPYGDINGLFISNDEEIKANLGSRLYFSECLGKHSEHAGPLEKDDLEVLTEDQEFINKFEKIIGKSFGYNPLNYIQ